MIDASDRMRFFERMHDHIRQEMIDHIKYRRNITLTATLSAAAVFAWILKEAGAYEQVGMAVRYIPVLIMLLGFAANEAANHKISRHIEYLKQVERGYNLGSLTGFETYSSHINRGYAWVDVLHEKWVTRIYFIFAMILLIGLTYFFNPQHRSFDASFLAAPVYVDQADHQLWLDLP